MNHFKLGILNKLGQTEYLVTGGCGFIGSHLVDRLIELGNKVVVLDDLSTGSEKNLNSETTFYQGDVNDRKLVIKILSSHNFDAIIYQASHINTSISEEDPRLDLNVNVEGCLNFIEAALKFKVRKFMFASSVAVYGSPKKLPVGEEGPIKPIYSYGIAKYCAEEYIRYYAKYRQLNYNIIRYGNIFGPRQPIFGEVGVVAIFTEQLLNNQPFVVYGDGHHVRDYLFVRDAVDGTLTILNSENSGTFNLASGVQTSVNELVHKFEEAAGKKIDILPKPERRQELGKFYADISSMKAVFGWEPKYKLVDGINMTLAYYGFK